MKATIIGRLLPPSTKRPSLLTLSVNRFCNMSDSHETVKLQFHEAPFLDLHLSISNGFVSSKIYDKRGDFDFDIVYFPFLDGDVPRRPSYGVYISQLIRFARVCS